jgi:hypothetical protein
MLLQYLQDRLHGAPSGTPHVDDHCETLLPHFITASRTQTAAISWWRAPQQTLWTHCSLWWRWWLFFVLFLVMEHRWNEIDRGKPKNSGKNLS